MEILYLIIPLSIVLVGIIIWIFMWAVRSGQFDDLEGPAYRIIMEDDVIIKSDDTPSTDSPEDERD